MRRHDEGGAAERRKMARTTVDLDVGVIEELKRRAAASRESMSQLLNRLAREGLMRAAQTGEPERLRWHVLEDVAPAPGFDPADRGYLDLLDEGR